MSLPFTVERTDTNVIKVKMDIKGKGWEQSFLLRSDVHHDNVDCRRDLEYKHLNEAVKQDAGVIDNGDLFCAMQGKYDRRSDKSKVRPEHNKPNYLDALVDTTAIDYKKYANNFVSIGRGNHEMGIKKNHETDLTERLVNKLNDQNGSNIMSMGYTGFIIFQFKRSNESYRKTLWYTHGYGGGGPVTEDMIQAKRQLVYIDEADVMMSGHVHRSWINEFVKIGVNKNGHQYRREGWYVKTPTYKDEYKDGVEGFSVERGMGPRPLGAYWLKFRLGRRDRNNSEIKMRIVKADN